MTVNVLEIIEQQKDKAGRKIIWEKWSDPFGADIEDREWPGAIGNFHADKKIDEADRRAKVAAGELPEEWNESEFDMPAVSKEYMLKKANKAEGVKMLMTELGIIPIMEHNRAGNVFNFWVAHTNFRLTQSIIDLIDKTEGIETFDVYTAYRWRISIAKAFDTAEVKTRLAHALKAEESAPYESNG